MPSYKVLRMSEDLHRELSAILREMKDPRVSQCMLSVVRVELSRDMSSCKVFVSSLNGMEAAREAVAALKGAAGFVRQQLCQRVEMRHTPELTFIADDSIEHSAEISKILKNL